MQNVLFFLLSLLFVVSCHRSPEPIYSHSDWAHYLGDPAVSHFSTLNQIDTANVQNLKVVWEYASGNPDSNNRSQIQCNPLIIDEKLYGTSPALRLFALNAFDGERLWEFDPFDGTFDMYGMGVNRGLNYWEEGSDKRIMYACGSHLFAIDALTGRLIHSFGDSGRVDLRKGLDREIGDLFIVNNTPGIVYNDLLILGSRVSESIGHVPGHIRAFDIKSGEVKWIFHTIPHPGEFGYDTWPEDAYLRSGGANAWAGFSLDVERGIVYVPTGSASFDFYGGDREGENLFANCIIALDANTGERIWHFQTVHHDIWDKDLPAPPNLVAVEKDGRRIDAIAQITKSGFLFVLDRVTGEPLFPVQEVEVLPSDLDGEHSWSTQPVPTGYPRFSRTGIELTDLAIRTEQAAAEAREIWQNSKKGSQFIPPSLEGTIIFPGFDGGGEWGGAAYHPGYDYLYVNSNEMPWMLQMEESEPAPPGQMIYSTMCQTCHAADLTGNEMFGEIPSLVDIGNRRTNEEITEVIKFGKGLMPSFQVLSDDQIKEVSGYIMGIKGKENAEETVWPYPYYFAGYNKLKASDDLPIIRPPWGQLTAIDLNQAKIAWQVPLGNHEELNIPGYPVTGTENYGGPVVTAGGLLFIAAASDEKIRAFHDRTGQNLWEHDLPAAGYATPATYLAGGKQFVVIACGGGKLGTKSGDRYMAFSIE